MTTKKLPMTRVSAEAEKLDPEGTDHERFSPQYLLNLLVNVGGLLSTVYDRRSPLTRNQTRVISSLLASDGQTQTDLANALEIHKVSIGIYVGELESMGLVERRPHPTDRRAKCIFLTPKLHATKHIGINQYEAIHHVATEGVDRNSYLTMLDCIELMRANLTELDRKDRVRADNK